MGCWFTTGQHVAGLQVVSRLVHWLADFDSAKVRWIEGLEVDIQLKIVVISLNPCFILTDHTEAIDKGGC